MKPDIRIYIDDKTRRPYGLRVSSVPDLCFLRAVAPRGTGGIM